MDLSYLKIKEKTIMMFTICKKEYCKGIDKIKYEEKESNNLVAFKLYDENRIDMAIFFVETIGSLTK